MHPLFTPRPLAAALSLLMFFSQTAGAQSWVDITSNLPAAPKVGTGQSLASDGPALYALATPNGVLRSTDNGATWSTYNTVGGVAYDLSQYGSRSIDAIDGALWAGVEPGSGALTNGVLPLYRTTPPAAWTPSFSGATIPATVDAVAFDSSTNTRWAAGRLGGIFKSTDGGNTWAAANGNLPGTNCASIVARNGTVIAAILGNGMGAFTSTNGGVTWTNNGVPLDSIGFLTGVGDEVCVIGQGATTLIDGIYFSKDFGLTWQFTQTDTASGLKLLTNTTSDATTMFSGGTELILSPFTYVPKVAFSLNGGATWDDIPAIGIPNGNPNGINRLARHGNYLFALTGANKLYRLDLTTVTLTPTLKIAVHPKIDKRITGGKLTMKVFAGGPGTLTYQWKKDNVDVSGQTSDTLSITNAQPSNTGNYTCVVTSGPSSVTSSAARGTVVDKIEGRYDPTYDRTNMSGGESGAPFLQSDGSLIVPTTGGVYKLGPNGGKTDSRTISAAGTGGRIVDSSGRVVLGGGSSVSNQRVRRLSGTTGFPDDPGFPLLATNQNIGGIVEQPGVGYLIHGVFTGISPASPLSYVTVPKIARVSYSGTIDTAFNTNLTTTLGLQGGVTPSQMFVDGDGFIWLVYGDRVLKLNSSGTAAAGFTPYIGLSSPDYISSSKLLSSGKLLVTLATSSSRPLKLIKSDGTFDSTFNTANLSLTAPFSAVAEQADGKIILGGAFAGYGTNVFTSRYLRVSANGVFDSTFYNATGFSGNNCTALVYDPRGYVLMASSTNNATTGTFQDSSTIGDTIGQNFVRVFSTLAPVSNPLETFLADAGVPANLRGPNDDPDNDGLKNLLEYALDLNPNGSGGTFTGSLPSTATTPTLLQFTYRRVRNDVSYAVETSTDLASGSWTIVGVNQGTPAGDGTTTASIPLGSGSAFLRLVVRLNP